jgi:crotonobetainyl-CoA:carnitine CoA-transferase CaiB-like acyl-CoA transferase
MLDGARILAWGARSAVELCARLLERAGAAIDFADAERVVDPDQIAVFLKYDAVIVSSDKTSGVSKRTIFELKSSGETIVCDITATGSQSSWFGERLTDGQIQAITGLTDTTGFPDGEPIRIGVPFTEMSAAMYAASAIAVALRVKGDRGVTQNIDVTLFGCAATALTTFLPKAFDRGIVGRVGNRHPACAPWNAYRTKDGWVLICTSTDEQWSKIKSAAALNELNDMRFASLESRVRNVDMLDELIERWSITMTTEECSRLCEQIGVAAGPIVSINTLHDEPNFLMRHPLAAHSIRETGIGRETFRDVTAFRSLPLASSSSPLDSSVFTNKSIGGASPGVANEEPALDRLGPLAGVKVIEIGQYTTAPLVGKHLAALGARVIKVEPPAGEAARAWLPGQAGLGYFFALNNTDKETIALDLKQDADRIYLRRLIETADVLVENLRPGALSKLGFGRENLCEINPRLIYCSISGFGIDSVYPTRPAFDTVVQAMSGLMDLTRSDDLPVKIGASGADILGGQSALFAIVAALTDRFRKTGTFVEISMQDVAAWCALYAAGNPERKGMAVACLDGHIWLESDDSHDVDSLRACVRLANCASATRTRALAELALIGVRGVPVVRVDELLDDGDFLADVLSVGRDRNGVFWPILKVPYRLTRTPAKVRVVPGSPVAVDVRDTAEDEQVSSRYLTDAVRP